MGQPITFASNQPTMGGGEVMLFALAEAARELGHDVTVVAPEYPSDVVDESRRRGFNTVGIHGRTTVDYLRGLRAWDGSHRQGLLWCNGLRPALATAGHRHRIVELHQHPSGAQKLMARVARQGVLQTVVPSHDMAAAIPGTSVLWNWVDDVPQAARPRQQPIRVGMLGRLSIDKGVLVACEAIRELERRTPGRYRLVVAGESRFVDPVEAERIDQALHDLGDLCDRRGWIDRDEFFADVDVAVFPSVWREPFGLVVAEAMAAKVPFVVSDAGALGEVAGPGYPLVVPAGDPVALASAVQQATEPDEGLLDAMRDRWSEHFSPRAGRRRLADLLDSLNRPAGGVRPTRAEPRVALVHDYFTQRGGAERVALTLSQAYPEAELTTSVYAPDSTYPELATRDVHTSWMDRIDVFKRNFRLGLGLYPVAFSTTVAGRDADVLIVSTTGFAHGVRTPAKKLVYCHSPARFLYLSDDYLGRPWWRAPSGWALKVLRPALVAWDQRAARSADRYLANSSVVQRRIKQVYGIDAEVVHPPHSIDPQGVTEPLPLPEHAASGFHLMVSRLMPYKNVDVVIEAFRQMPERHLVIIGRGPLGATLRRNLPANVTMLEGISDAQLRWAYTHAIAVIAPSHEDFGLTPVEGFAFGTPTLALRAGGYLDTVVEGVSGWFFDRATPAEVRAAVERLDGEPLSEQTVREHAEQFSPAAFRAAIQRHVDDLAGVGQ
ncbi:glycosyltransferase family 4 protein [Aestuariimicrobium ganziense]|uniref:glycosyltransferase family 4 protein n=1 Tax=Aestuariimicrobium ganziense TaxID=2773677 RepID=UPI001F3647F4|nr:glycosyltransferase [Aestuariimicrobium ganziense]